LRAEGLAISYRVEGGEVVLVTPGGELRLRGSASLGRASLGGSRALASLAISLALAALMVASYPPWSLRAGFAITVAYYGILLGLAFAAYLSADAARPRRAVIVSGPGYRRAFILLDDNERH
jgi:hypothetical protein